MDLTGKVNLTGKICIENAEQIPELAMSLLPDYHSVFFEWRSNDRRLRLPRMTHAARRLRSELAGHRALYPKNRKQRKAVALLSKVWGTDADDTVRFMDLCNAFAKAVIDAK